MARSACDSGTRAEAPQRLSGFFSSFMNTRQSPEDDSDIESEPSHGQEYPRGSRDCQSRESHHSLPKPGKFHSLRDFVKLDNNNNKSHHTGYRLAHELDLQPGDVFHIGDSTGSRIDGRAMLMVKTHCHSNMTCVSFCLHSDISDYLPRIHRQVRQRAGDARRIEVDQDARRATSHETMVELSLPVGVTLNIHEMWNVEREVQVRLLDSVSNWPSVRSQIVDAFVNDTLHMQVHDVESRINESLAPLPEHDLVQTVIVQPAATREHSTREHQERPGVPERHRSQGKRSEKRYWKVRDASDRHHIGFRVK